MDPIARDARTSPIERISVQRRRLRSSHASAAALAVFSFFVVAVPAAPRVRIDQASGAQSKVVSIPGAVAVAVSPHAVWVGEEAPHRALVRVDPETLRLVGQTIIPATAVVVGIGAVWAGSVGLETHTSGMSRIDPVTGHVIRRTTAFNAIALTTAAGSVWSADGAYSGTVRRVYPNSLRVAARIRLNGQPYDLAATRRYIWVALPAANAVARIDRENNRVHGSLIRVGAGPFTLASGFGQIWVANDNEGTVSRLDPATGRVVVRAIRIGRRAADVTVGGGLVWASDPENKALVAISPRSNRVVKRIHVPGQPFQLAFGDGYLWAVDNVNGLLIRIHT